MSTWARRREWSPVSQDEPSELRRLSRFNQAWRDARSRSTRDALVMGLLSEVWSGIEEIIREIRRSLA